MYYSITAKYAQINKQMIKAEKRSELIRNAFCKRVGLHAVVVVWPDLTFICVLRDVPAAAASEKGAK